MAATMISLVNLCVGMLGSSSESYGPARLISVYGPTLWFNCYYSAGSSVLSLSLHGSMTPAW